MKEENLIGKEIVGFKFKGTSECNWVLSISKHIGKIGKIIEESKTSCYVKFDDDDAWWFPTDQVLKQLKEEEEIDINALFEQIKNI